MNRNMLAGLGVTVVAFALGLPGCGESAKEGVPADLTPAVSPADMNKFQMTPKPRNQPAVGKETGSETKK